jgi:hypothetical protein
MKKLYNYTYSYIIDKDNRTVTAISEYAGKPVKGIAKCSPEDVFNEDIGLKLAIARCKAKIADKQYKTTKEKVKRAQFLVSQANKRLEKARKERKSTFRDMCLSLGEKIRIEKDLK